MNTNKRMRSKGASSGANAGADQKVLCETPTPGRKPTRIHRWKYDLVRKAVLAVIPKRGEGVLFKELPALVGARLSADERERLGSLGWYTTTVKLHLEVIGELQRCPGAGPQRLLRC